jgi:hypothetical protein
MMLSVGTGGMGVDGDGNGPCHGGAAIITPIYDDGYRDGVEMILLHNAAQPVLPVIHSPCHAHLPTNGHTDVRATDHDRNTHPNRTLFAMSASRLLVPLALGTPSVDRRSIRTSIWAAVEGIQGAVLSHESCQWCMMYTRRSKDKLQRAIRAVVQLSRRKSGGPI